MTEIIDLGKERLERKLIWVCRCGCTVFRCHEDGGIECPECERITDQYTGEWRIRLPVAPEKPRPTDGKCFKVISIDTAVHWLKRMAPLVAEKEVAMGLILFADGSSNRWLTEIKGKAQANWLQRRFKEVMTGIAERSDKCP